MKIRVTCWLVLASALMGSSSVLAAAPYQYDWGGFGAASSIKGGDYDVRIIRQNERWVLRRTLHRLKPGGGLQFVDVVQWADAKNCPRIAERIAALSALQIPRVDFPPEPFKGSLTSGQGYLDGSSTYVELPVIFGRDGASGSRMRLENYVNGAVEEWVTLTINAAHDCWTDQAPYP